MRLGISKKRLLLTLLTLVVAGGGLVVWRTWFGPGRQLTVENIKRIEKGMQIEEVLAILGEPGDYRLLRLTKKSESIRETLDQMEEAWARIELVGRLWHETITDRPEIKTYSWSTSTLAISAGTDHGVVVHISRHELTPDYLGTLKHWLRLD